MDLQERDVLAAIEARPNVPTYVIRNVLVGEKDWPKGLKTRHILRTCKRLEAVGKITQTGLSSNSICWSVVT